VLVLYADGLCEPVNPGGTACYGWVAYYEDQKQKEGFGVVCSGPDATNNVAEYFAVIAALNWALLAGLTEDVEVCSDSQLCIRQLNREYRVKSERIRPLYNKAFGLSKQFKKIKFRWVPREQNEEADSLSRKAYKQYLKKSSLEIKHQGSGIFLVPSHTRQGASYTVDIINQTCSCPDHQKRKRICKHIASVEQMINRKLAQEEEVVR